jgi:hypothetical protein
MNIPDIQPTMFNELLYNLKHKENIALAVTDPIKNEACYLVDGAWKKMDDSQEFINDILMVNATEIKKNNYNLPKDLQRNPNDLNPLFNTDSILPKIIKQAYDNLHIVEEVHGPVPRIK